MTEGWSIEQVDHHWRVYARAALRVRDESHPGSKLQLVYVVRCGESGPVKIGFAENIDKRLKQFQTAHHERLFLLRIVFGGSDVERWLHDRFAHLRRRGEWFEFNPDILHIGIPPLDMLEARHLTFDGWVRYFPNASRKDCEAVRDELDNQSRLLSRPSSILDMLLRAVETFWDARPEMNLGEAFAEFMKIRTEVQNRLASPNPINQEHQHEDHSLRP